MRLNAFFNVAVGLIAIVSGLATVYQVAVPRAEQAARVEVTQEFLEQLTAVGFDTSRASEALNSGDIEQTISESITFEDIDRRIADAVATALAKRDAALAATAQPAVSATPPEGLFDNPSCLPITDLMGRETAMLHAEMEFCSADGRPLVRIDRINPPEVGIAGGSINYTLGTGQRTNCAGNCKFYGTEVPDFNLERHAVENGRNVVLVRF